MTSETRKMPGLRVWPLVRTVLLAAVMLGALAVATSRTLGLLSGATCDNHLLEVATSPDGSRKAYVFRRSCSGAPGPSTQVSVLSAEAGPPPGTGNVLISDADDVLVRWLSPDRLSITQPTRAATSLSAHQVGGITVSYE